MFKRIIYDEWTNVIPIVSFWLTFSVFIVICLRAMLQKKANISKMAQLPFEERIPDNATARQAQNTISHEQE